MPPPLPSPTTALGLAREALFNAADLVADANLLLAEQRWPRAFALGVLALEEVGKMILCAGVALTRTANTKEFWTAFRNHATKLGNANGLLEVVAKDVSEETLAAVDRAFHDAASGHKRKMRGMYVDLADDGTVERPDDITETECRAVLEGARALLDVLGPAWLSDTFEAKMAEVLTDHAEPFQHALDLVVEAVKVVPQDALRLGRGLLLGDLPPMADAEQPTDTRREVAD